MSEHVDALVIGAGLAGLNAALTPYAAGMVLAGDHREMPSQQCALPSGRRAAEVTLRSLR